MGWKYEVVVYFSENCEDRPVYQGHHLIPAVNALRKARKLYPGRCYSLVIR